MAKEPPDMLENLRRLSTDEAIADASSALLRRTYAACDWSLRQQLAVILCPNRGYDPPELLDLLMMVSRLKFEHADMRARLDALDVEGNRP